VIVFEFLATSARLRGVFKRGAAPYLSWN